MRQCVAVVRGDVYLGVITRELIEKRFFTGRQEPLR
jgi:hypothetical protein